MAFDGIFLDMYGTLTAGDKAAVEKVCSEIVSDHKLPFDAAELSVRWGDRFFALVDRLDHDSFMTLYDVEATSLIETIRACEIDIDPKPYVEQLAGYWRNPDLHPESRHFIENCPVPICIVSNADREDVEMAFRRHELEVHAIITSEDVQSYKPAPHIFEVALQTTGWKRSRVIHIGDSVHSDVGGAMAARVRSGWLNRQHRIHDIGQHTPDHEFADLNEVLSFLRLESSN